MNNDTIKNHISVIYFRTSFSIVSSEPKTGCSCEYHKYYGTSAYEYVSPYGYEVKDGYGKSWLSTKVYEEAKEFRDMLNNLCKTAQRFERENERLTSSLNKESYNFSNERKIGKAVLEILKASKEIL